MHSQADSDDVRKAFKPVIDVMVKLIAELSRLAEHQPGDSGEGNAVVMSIQSFSSSSRIIVS